MKRHKCFVQADKFLADKNARLATNLLNDSNVFVEVEKLDEKIRGRLPVMIATYCPFCGKKLETR
jgi:hypothetical protein